jgi:two-component system NtrC family response regulator
MRQLRNVLERALILCQGQEILVDHLPQEITGNSDAASAATGDPDALWERWLDAAPFHDMPLDAVKEHIDRLIIIRALRAQAGNRAQTARALHLNADQLRFRIQKYGLNDAGGAHTHETVLLGKES